MTDPSKPREVFIQGITRAGKTFRPSDWSERLAGALSSFRPKSSGIGAHIGYRGPQSKDGKLVNHVRATAAAGGGRRGCAGKGKPRAAAPPSATAAGAGVGGGGHVTARVGWCVARGAAASWAGSLFVGFGGWWPCGLPSATKPQWRPG